MNKSTSLFQNYNTNNILNQEQIDLLVATQLSCNGTCNFLNRNTEGLVSVFNDIFSYEFMKYQLKLLFPFTLTLSPIFEYRNSNSFYLCWTFVSTQVLFLKDIFYVPSKNSKTSKKLNIEKLETYMNKNVFGHWLAFSGSSYSNQIADPQSCTNFLLDTRCFSENDVLALSNLISKKFLLKTSVLVVAPSNVVLIVSISDPNSFGNLLQHFVHRSSYYRFQQQEVSMSAKQYLPNITYQSSDVYVPTVRSAAGSGQLYLGGEDINLQDTFMLSEQQIIILESLILSGVPFNSFPDPNYFTDRGIEYTFTLNKVEGAGLSLDIPYAQFFYLENIFNMFEFLKTSTNKSFWSKTCQAGPCDTYFDFFDPLSGELNCRLRTSVSLTTTVNSTLKDLFIKWHDEDYGLKIPPDFVLSEIHLAHIYSLLGEICVDAISGIVSRIYINTRSFSSEFNKNLVEQINKLGNRISLKFRVIYNENNNLIEIPLNNPNDSFYPTNFFAFTEIIRPYVNPCYFYKLCLNSEFISLANVLASQNLDLFKRVPTNPYLILEK